ncbi:MAG TPA: hypothetical protein PKE63_02540 [Lacibacter sp.]|nr:hypothetical protein [Lacibacter sp.]HMO89927.1 hypothetical protein [Lacibacter sp.]HMP86124.1 hypothetical protein [Lacibacter sp.]
MYNTITSNRTQRKVILRIRVILLLGSCLLAILPAGAQQLRTGDAGKIVTGRIADTIYQKVLKALVLEPDNEDTLIINYAYNADTCWNALERQGADDITQVVQQRQHRFRMRTIGRIFNRFYTVYEPGNRTPKVISFDYTYQRDANRQLFYLLFAERCICGQSIILLPDRRYIRIRSDSHLGVLNITADEIEAVFEKKGK